jgi:hypothetical protein
MLDLVHQHWKRRRVCKIKCKGVPTVDMDNVCNVLEVWDSPFFRTEAKFLYGYWLLDLERGISGFEID